MRRKKYMLRPVAHCSYCSEGGLDLSVLSTTLNGSTAQKRAVVLDGLFFMNYVAGSETTPPFSLTSTLQE